MKHIFERTEQLLGEAAVHTLTNKHVVLIGLGGVGSFACEALARCGVGKLTLIDQDVVDETNINRQLFALCSSIGTPKTLLAKERVQQINPRCVVEIHHIRVDESNIADLIAPNCDYVIDAIDTVSSKMAIIKECDLRNIPILSSMGMGNKTDPTKLMVSDIYRTSICPLAKIIRKLCKEAHIKHLRVVYSTELPLFKRTPPASIVFVPSTAGILLAREVVMSLIKPEDIS